MTGVLAAALAAAEEEARKKLEAQQRERAATIEKARTNIENVRQLALQFLIEKLSCDEVFAQAWVADDPDEDIPTLRGKWIFQIDQGLWVEYVKKTASTPNEEGVFVVDLCPKCGRPIRRASLYATAKASQDLAGIGIAIQRDRTEYRQHVNTCNDERVIRSIGPEDGDDLS